MPSSESAAEVVAKFGTSSAAISCFKGTMHALACSASYPDAVRKTLVAGGENAGRAMLVCLLLQPGAMHGACVMACLQHDLAACMMQQARQCHVC